MSVSKVINIDITVKAVLTTRMAEWELVSSDRLRHSGLLTDSLVALDGFMSDRLTEGLVANWLIGHLTDFVVDCLPDLLTDCGHACIDE